MARGVNKCFLIGHLGKDPELRYTQGGTAVANFSLATTESRKDGDSYTEFTEWHNIVVFSKTAENAAKYLAKGSQCYVEGRIQTRKWQDKSGNDRWSTEIVGFNIQFLGGKGEGKPEQSGGDNQQNNVPPGGGFDPSDDVPFAPFIG